MDESSVKDVIKNYNSMGLGAEAFAEQTNLTDESLKSYFKTVKSSDATYVGYKNHVASAATSTGLLGIKAKITAGAMKALKVAMSTIGTMILVVAIQKVIEGFDALHKSEKEIEEAAENAKQKIDELNESFKSQKSSVDDIKQRYAELAQGVDLLSNKNISLSNEDYEEFLNLSNQLADIFPRLTKGIDDNGNEILDLSGNVDTIVSSLDALLEREQMLTNKQILEEMPEAYEGYKQKYDQYKDEIDILERKQDALQKLQNIEYSVNNDTFENDAILKWNLPVEMDEKSLMDIEGQLYTALHDAGIDSDFITSYYKDLDTDGYALTLTIPKVELETNDVKSILGDYLSDVGYELETARYELENETSNFSKYMSIWLSDQSKYKGQSKEVKNALEEMMFSADWLDEAFKDPEVDHDNWDSLAKWFEENYLKAIDKINDKEIANKLNQLFAIDDAQLKIDLAKELQTYFDEKGIKISLDFILDENDDTSTQSIQNRFNQSLNDISGGSSEDKIILEEYIKENDISSEAQMNYWLKITQGIQGANQAIKEYEASFDKKVNYGFFTDDNLESIDEYKSKISDLSGFLQDIDEDGKLSADSLSKLHMTYKISADSTDEYRIAIVELMNKLATTSDIMVTLKEAIESCTDVELKSILQSLYDSLMGVNTEAQQSSQSFYNLSESVSQLETSATLLRELDELMSAQGFIDTSKADDILSVFPEMEEDVAKFNAGLMDSDELFALLVEAYEDDEQNYAKSIAIKNEYNTDYYNDWLENLSDWVKDTAESYGIDLTNYKTLNEAKLALDKEYAKRKATLESAIETSDKLNTIAINSSEGTQLRDQAAALSAYDNVMNAEANLDNMLELINAVEDSFQVDASWQEFGKDNDSDKDNSTEIDWADQSLKVLQDEVDKYQTALDNTKGINNQIEAIDDLNGALRKLKTGYKEAYAEYKDRYDNAKISDDIRQKIESGKEFDLSVYDSDTAEVIQKAIDDYNAMVEAGEKIKEISNTIGTNKNIEKSKLLQQSYELQLETINTKLEDQTLSVEEKNALLDIQLKLQNAINKELRKQAIYEEDFETVAKLDAEDKNRKLQNRLDKLQGKRDQNQVYIDTYNEALENTSLTSDEINDLNDSLHSATNKDFKYQFKAKIKTIGDEPWNDYISSLKEKYSEQDMNDKKFIKKHLDEISEHFADTGMEELYYEYLNSERSFKTIDYETKKNERTYHQNDINNNIQDIQSEIELKGGRGTEEQYKELESLYGNSRDYWVEQKADAEAMRDSFEAYTAEWDKWNTEAQECDDNISKCDQSIKECQMSILKLPLNEVDDALKDIESKLSDINKDLDKQTDLISAASAVIDNEIKNQEVLKEAIQDQIDALQKENNLREANLNVQKAEYELEKAKNQRSSKIFHEGQGWIYESDADTINTAQQNFDNAKYEYRLAILQDQITVFDDEIERLNEIKERWSDIATEAENLVLINKAIAYDSGFVGKVLIENAALIGSIASTYSSLTSQKESYEDQQEDYTTLQDVINDTVEMYDLEAIGYEEAKQRIKNAIMQYYPEIVSNYENEEETLERVAEKKLEDAGVTEETSEDILDTVKKSNKQILKNYNKLVDGLEEVFGQLNGMLDAYSSNTKAMVSSISASIEELRTQLSSVQSEVDDTTITTETTTSVKSSEKEVKKVAAKKKDNTKSAGKSHSGLELGYIGESSSSKDKDAFRYIALNELKNNEIVRVLQKNEAVLTEGQVSQVMDNFRKVTQVKVPTLLPNNLQSNSSVNFNGDIIVQGVQNTDSLANAIKTQLPNAMLQELYK